MCCLGARATVVSGVIVDSTDDSPLPACAVAMMPGARSAQTDIDGRFTFKVSPGDYIIKASYVGFDDYEQAVAIGRRDTTLLIRLMPKNQQLKEVTITAKESTGVTSSSRIDRDAMAHLQPSSFADLLELLPGNISQDPTPGTVNSIKLRETGTIGANGQALDSPDYAMSSLGTAFNVDGAPVNNDANLQSVGIESASGRNSVNRGVDMRTLSTDNIESVEIVRGIPSAEYGNLSSGLVNIRRTRRATPLTARFKADGYSKLFFIGKGIAVGPQRRNTLNADIGYLDSKVDPRNNLENFRRISASVRSSLGWESQSHLTEWNLAADYTGTTEIDYLPLHIGRVTLPGVIQRTNTWETAATPCHYSESAAQALALRACRAQLYREFPDAIIEAERRSIDPGEDAAACTVTYIFCANIAEKP